MPNSSICLPVQEESQIGMARRAAGELCRRFGGDEVFNGRVSIVVAELSRNLVLHGGGGEILLRWLTMAERGGVEVLALDKGPGMRNAAECMRDGYSTAGTQGTGLGAVRRLSDLFEFNTTPAKGTAICAQLFPSTGELRHATKDASLKIGAVCRALASEPVCGDAWSVTKREKIVRILVVDGLGHGMHAAEAAQDAVTVFQSMPERPCTEVLEAIHRSLFKTRGAAGAIAEINPQTRQISTVGAGNICLHVINEHGKSRQVASVNGTLGASLHKISEYTTPWHPDNLLVMHSDGLSAQFGDLSVYPGLLMKNPALISGVIYRDFSRHRDDATIVTVSLS